MADQILTTSYTERAVRLAKLLVSQPEAVFDALKEYAGPEDSDGVSTRWWHLGRCDGPLEWALLERGEPLIDLGLARYASTAEIVSSLYKRTLIRAHVWPIPAPDQDPRYLSGLRISCLSNRSVERVRGGIIDLLGQQEVQRLVSDGNDEELWALVCNPTVESSFLESLYDRTGPFSGIPDERWLQIVGSSSENPRLKATVDFAGGPDFEVMGVQKSILRLLGATPVTPQALQVLERLLLALNVNSTATPTEDIDPIIERWAALVDTNQTNQAWVHRGRSTSAWQAGWGIRSSHRSAGVMEFCCLIAALYGRRLGVKKVRRLAWKEGRYERYEEGEEEIYYGRQRDLTVRRTYGVPLGSVLRWLAGKLPRWLAKKLPNDSSGGSATDGDVVARCAYYGKGSLSLADMERGYGVDYETFTNAALCNRHILYSKELSAWFEQNCLSGWSAQRYLEMRKQAHLEPFRVDPNPVTSKRGVFTGGPKLDLRADSIDKSLSQLSAQIDAKFYTAGWWLVAAVMVLAFFTFRLGT